MTITPAAAYIPAALADLDRLAACLRARGCHTACTLPGPSLAIRTTPTSPPHTIHTTGLHFYLAPSQLIGPRTDIPLTADALAWALHSHRTP